MAVTVTVKGTAQAEAQLKRKLLAATMPLLKETADAYLADLQAHLGDINGSTAYSDADVSWEALKEPGQDPSFWSETGAVERSLVLNVVSQTDGIQVFVGVPKGTEAYDETLFNELGFSHAGSGMLIKRPVFIPLAEHHVSELKTRLIKALSRLKLTVRVTNGSNR